MLIDVGLPLNDDDWSSNATFIVGHFQVLLKSGTLMAVVPGGRLDASKYVVQITLLSFTVFVTLNIRLDVTLLYGTVSLTTPTVMTGSPSWCHFITGAHVPLYSIEHVTSIESFSFTVSWELTFIEQAGSCSNTDTMSFSERLVHHSWL